MARLTHGLFVVKIIYCAVSAEKISIDRSVWNGKYRVVSSTSGVLGSDGTIRGAGGSGYIDVAKNSGADALRTWGVDELGKVLHEAETHGLRVSSGIWLPHSPSYYEKCDDLNADPRWIIELDRYLRAVRTFRSSPAILWWTVGNEQEIEIDALTGNECVWKRLEWVVKGVRHEDPDHPVGTVLAGVAEPKVQAISRLCPSLHFLGANSYGDASLRVGSQLRSWNWTRPFAIMEFGPSGHWVAPVTEWGAYIEETSSEKVPRYNATCYSCYDDPQCIGAFAFVWGWKWEKTGTWYNLFNEWRDVTEGVAVPCHDCQSEVLSTLQTCWTGHRRPNLPPTIRGVEVDGEVVPDMSFSVPRNGAVSIKVRATHPLGKSLIAIWAATAEVVSNAIGGAWEATNPLVPYVWTNGQTVAAAPTESGQTVMMNTSGMEVGGAYRLYVFVRQDPSTCSGPCDQQEAVASLPFYICQTVQPDDKCYDAVKYAMEVGIHVHPQTYPGVSVQSSFEEFQMLLFQKGEGHCFSPCGLRDWCHTSVEGDECHAHVRWAIEHGMKETPDLYPWWLPTNVTFEEMQKYLYDQKNGICPRPCKSSTSNSVSSGDGGNDRRLGASASTLWSSPFAEKAANDRYRGEPFVIQSLSSSSRFGSKIPKGIPANGPQPVPGILV